jgi:hypothetical protein
MTPKQRLPRRFPVGTRLVIEGEPDRHGALRVVSRYVVMPNGRRYDLMPQAGAPQGTVPPAAAGARRSRRSAATA